MSALSEIEKFWLNILQLFKTSPTDNFTSFFNLMYILKYHITVLFDPTRRA